MCTGPAWEAHDISSSPMASCAELLHCITPAEPASLKAKIRSRNSISAAMTKYGTATKKMTKSNQRQNLGHDPLWVPTYTVRPVRTVPIELYRPSILREQIKSYTKKVLKKEPVRKEKENRKMENVPKGWLGKLSIKAASLSKVLLLFKPESKPQKQGDTESEFKRLTTPGVWNGGRSKIRSLRSTRVTPNSSTPKTTTHNSTGTWWTKRQRCMSHDTTHTLVPHQRHTLDLTHEGRSSEAINVGPQ